MATRVVLNSKLDSAQVDSLKKTLLQSKNDDLELDGSAVEQIGGLCVELLLSVRHLWVAAGKSFVLENASDRLIEDLHRFGLTAEDFKGRPA